MIKIRIKRKQQPMSTPSQTKTTIRPNTFTAQDAGIHSNAELVQVGTECFSLDILIQHFIYLKKPLVIHSFAPLLRTIQFLTSLRLILTIHFVLDYMINQFNSTFYTWFSWFSPHSFPMLLSHYLVIHVTSSLNVENLFRDFFSCKINLFFSSNSIKKLQ